MNYCRVKKSKKSTTSNTPKPPKRIKETIQPRRHFKAWRVSSTSFSKLIEKIKDNKNKDEAVIIEEHMEDCNFRVICELNDEEGNQEEFDLSKMHERSHHFKSFLFKVCNGRVFIIEKQILGILEKYYFCDAPHYGYVPAETIYPGLSLTEQRSVFKEFQELIEDAETINGFPIYNQRHHTSQPIIRQLLIRISNSQFFSNN